MNWLWFAGNAVPAVGLYLWFKVREKNLLDDWGAIFRDGLASAVASAWLGLTIVLCFEGWSEYLGWGLVVWSLTYWASAFLAWRNLQALKAGKPVFGPLDQSKATAPKAQGATLNRQQRRKLKKRS
jgi:hypothetical protein